MIKPRQYQIEAVDAIINSLSSVDDDSVPGNPVAAIPTGAGKTLIVCMLTDQILTEHPNSNILILSHVKEILDQNYKAINNYYEESLDVGLYSAGLNSKTIKKVTVAGIQSAYRNIEDFEDFDIIIVDECHLVSTKNEGMYYSLISELDCNCIGLTATPFRLGYGYIYNGENAIFTNIAYDLTSLDNFNKLIDDGYLTKIISKGTDKRMSIEGISKIGGELNQNQLSVKFDRKEYTESICSEIIKFGKNYKKWLIFAIDIDHSNHIAELLNASGIETASIHSEMNDREKVIENYRNGAYRAAVNVNIMTTGLDVPDIDLIAMVRPTVSPIVHVQSAGRGLRIAPGKDHCLFLDFAGNTERLGPINNVLVKEKGKGSKTGVAPIKECPDCKVHNPISAKECYICGHVFKHNLKLHFDPSSKEIIQKNKKDPIDWYDINVIRYEITRPSYGKIPTLKVSYYTPQKTINEWICYDHPKGKYPKNKANAWVKYRLQNGETMPKNLIELGELAIKNKIKAPKRIKVDFRGKYPEIKDSLF